MTLIVALPENDLEMAEAAIEAGADALQLDFRGEKAKPKKILDKADIPVGIVPSGKNLASDKELQEIAKLGFDFISAEMGVAPAHFFSAKKISKILSLNSKFNIDQLIEISAMQSDALDAAIIPASGWGKELVVGDLQNYISIVLSANIPVIIPTQRSIRPSEVAIIADTGAKGLLLSSIVTGATPKQIAETVREYREAIDEIGK
jgi:hypothetical protein